MQGHDFLENLRNPKIWRKVKDIAAKAGVEITFELIKQAIPKILGSIIESSRGSLGSPLSHHRTCGSRITAVSTTIDSIVEQV